MARCDCGHVITQLSEARWVVDGEDGPVTLLCVECFDEHAEYDDSDLAYEGYQQDVADYGGAS